MFITDESIGTNVNFNLDFDGWPDLCEVLGHVKKLKCKNCVPPKVESSFKDKTKTFNLTFYNNKIKQFNDFLNFYHLKKTALISAIQ